MKDQLKLTRKLRYIIVSSICIIIAIISIGIFINDCRLELLAVDTNGKILSVEYKEKEIYATVEYRVQGELYTVPVHIKNQKQELVINDDITIKYNINDPGSIIYNDHLREILLSMFISLIGIILTLPKSIKIIKEYKYNMYLKTEGLHITATVFDVYVDNKTKKYKNKFPYRLRCKYLNPEDNEEYVFDSDYSYIDLKRIIADNKTKEVAVYLDKNNTKNHYVDLDSLIEGYKPINKIERVNSNEKSDESSSNEQD